MTKINYVEFVNVIRSKPQFVTVPVMMLVCKMGGKQIVEALRSRANEYMMKPFTANIGDARLQLIRFCWR